MSEAPKKPSRIQQRNRGRILDAGLDVFSAYGFRGATLDQISDVSGMSKPNILYYFSGKEEIHLTLLEQQLETWLEPLKALDPQGEPLEELRGYVQRKLELSRDFPRESRLFANEVLQGATRIKAVMEGELRDLVQDRAAVVQGWIDAGRLAPVDPVHLIISVWALTQHYADFDVQVRAVLGVEDPYPEAAAFLTTLFERLLKV